MVTSLFSTSTSVHARVRPCLTRCRGVHCRWSHGGIKDDSISMKVAGCGVQVGRKIGVSVLDNEVGVDLGKCTVM